MKLFFLSGLPRAGSTLLTSILQQNPDIHAEGNSAVCQLMWDMKQSVEGSCAEQLAANHRMDTARSLIESIPHIYYKNYNVKYVIDKCRSWTLPPNLDLIRTFITDDPKILVMVRPIEEVIESLANLRRANGWNDPYAGLRDSMSEPIMRSQFGVDYARATNSGEFLFIEYGDLIEDTVSVLERIYTFCGFDAFQHDLNNIVNLHKEDDSVYGLMGMHDVRPTIGYRDY